MLQLIVLGGCDAFPICAFVSRAINASQRTCEPSFRVGGGLSKGANGFVGETDVPPRAASVIATVHAAATGVEAPRPGKEALGITGIDANARDYSVLSAPTPPHTLPFPAST